MTTTKFLLWFLVALLPIAQGRISGRVVGETERDLTTDGEEMINVVVGYSNEESSTFQAHEGRRYLSQFDVRTRFKRANAISMRIRASEVHMLEQDPDVTYVEEDIKMYPLSEEYPWGVNLVNGNSADSIPSPKSGENCFKICVVDTGVRVEHPDIPFSRGDGKIEGRDFRLPYGQTWYNPSPSANHGTHVTGTIIAAGNNNIGVAGVISRSDNFCMMHARVFGDNISAGQYVSVIDGAVEWCADGGARVINMSLGFTQDLRASQEIYKQLTREGILVIAAAGNQGKSTYEFPASYSDVISVAAIDKNFKWASFSQHNDQVDITAPGKDIVSTVAGIGVTDQKGNKFGGDLMVYSVSSTRSIPGGLVDCGLGTSRCFGAEGNICLIERGEIPFVDKVRNCQTGGGIGVIVYNNNENALVGSLGGEDHGLRIPAITVSMANGQLLKSAASRVAIEFNFPAVTKKSGTSMAAPHVTGVASRIWAAKPSCSNLQVREALERTAVDLGITGRDDYYGHGLVQAGPAYNYLERLGC